MTHSEINARRMTCPEFLTSERYLCGRCRHHIALGVRRHRMQFYSGQARSPRGRKRSPSLVEQKVFHQVLDPTAPPWCSLGPYPYHARRKFAKKCKSSRRLLFLSREMGDGWLDKFRSRPIRSAPERHTSCILVHFSLSHPPARGSPREPERSRGSCVR